VDPDTGETNPNPQPGDLVVIAPTGPIVSLTNEVEERKRASGSVGMKTGKTGLIFRVFRTQRRFLTSLREEDVTGFSGSVNRRVAPRTNALLSGNWQRTKTDDPDNDRNNGSRDFWSIGTDLMRQIRPRLDGMVGYRFSRQEPGNGSGGYDENRVTARITAYF
jgi:uncharacterized protein (PEP-CTERM system associated)